MLDPKEVGQRFRTLRDEVVHEYEEKLKRNQEIYQKIIV